MTKSMFFFPRRRALLLGAVSLPLSLPLPGRAATLDAAGQLGELERASGGQLGLAALDSGSGRSLMHRAEQRFPFCSTFKAMLVGAVLARSATTPGLLARRLRYTKQKLVSYSPVTERHVAKGMRVAELCAAALQYSDNSAANFLMELIGGPAVVTAFARNIGDQRFRLDRWETDLNSALPGDERDTTTPGAMAASLHSLMLGEGLGKAQREQLVNWMLDNTTGDLRLRAGVPAGWKVADKTGTGNYGVSNDVGVLYRPAGAPIVLAVYFRHPDKDAKTNNAIIAAATRIVVTALA